MKAINRIDASPAGAVQVFFGLSLTALLLSGGPLTAQNAGPSTQKPAETSKQTGPPTKTPQSGSEETGKKAANGTTGGAVNEAGKAASEVEGRQAEKVDGSLDDFVRDFSTIDQGVVEPDYTWRFGVAAAGGFDERRPLAGFETYLDLRHDDLKASFFFPLYLREFGQQVKRVYEAERLDLKDSLDPAGYDYTDDINDIFWYIDAVTYRPRPATGLEAAIERMSSFSFGQGYLIHHYSNYTFTTLQNRRALFVTYADGPSNYVFFNDDIIDNDMVHFQFSRRPLPAHALWRYWQIEAGIFADFDPYDFDQPSSRFTDPSGSDQYYSGVSVNNALPLLVSDSNIIYLYTNVWAINNSHGMTAELTGGLGLKTSAFGLDLYTAYNTSSDATGLLFSPFFDLERRHFARLGRDSSATNGPFAFEASLNFFISKNWTLFFRNRVDQKPQLLYSGWGLEFKPGSSLTFSFGYYRRRVEKVEEWVSSHSGQAITRFDVGYLVFERLRFALEMGIEPMPASYTETARTQALLRSVYYFY